MIPPLSTFRTGSGAVKLLLMDSQQLLAGTAADLAADPAEPARNRRGSFSSRLGAAPRPVSVSMSQGSQLQLVHPGSPGTEAVDSPSRDGAEGLRAAVLQVRVALTLSAIVTLAVTVTP